MTNPLIEEKEIQLARAMSDKAIARTKIAAAILGITPKHLHDLAKRPDFPAKVQDWIQCGWMAGLRSRNLDRCTNCERRRVMSAPFHSCSNDTAYVTIVTSSTGPVNKKIYLRGSKIHKDPNAQIYQGSLKLFRLQRLKT